MGPQPSRIILTPHMGPPSHPNPALMPHRSHSHAGTSPSCPDYLRIVRAVCAACDMIASACSRDVSTAAVDRAAAHVRSNSNHTCPHTQELLDKTVTLRHVPFLVKSEHCPRRSSPSPSRAATTRVGGSASLLLFGAARAKCRRTSAPTYRPSRATGTRSCKAPTLNLSAVRALPPLHHM